MYADPIVAVAFSPKKKYHGIDLTKLHFGRKLFGYIFSPKFWTKTTGLNLSQLRGQKSRILRIFKGHWSVLILYLKMYN
jgi:hypothetical protein